MIILLMSQYYNIEDLFTFGANLKSDDINEHISISEKIFSICNSFQYNLTLIPNIISWEDSKNQIARVESIKAEITKAIELQKATKGFQDSPSHITAQRLQDIVTRLENED